MATFQIDVPAYVTLRVQAESAEEAARIVKQCDLLCHDWTPRHSADHYTETKERSGVEISGAITVYCDPTQRATVFEVSEPFDIDADDERSHEAWLA